MTAQKVLAVNKPCQEFILTGFNIQADHSPDTLKFPDISLTMCGTHALVKWYS